MTKLLPRGSEITVRHAKTPCRHKSHCNLQCFLVAPISLVHCWPWTTRKRSIGPILNPAVLLEFRTSKPPKVKSTSFVDQKR